MMWNPGVHVSIVEPTAKRVYHCRGAAFTEEIYCLAQTFASLRIELRFVFGVLWALSVSAVRFCSEVIFAMVVQCIRSKRFRIRFKRLSSRSSRPTGLKQIVLFGSLACGAPDEDSDIDLLIIKETDESPLARRVRVRQLVADPERRVPFSPLVLTPEELAHRLTLGDPFYLEIMRRGKVLYAGN